MIPPDDLTGEARRIPRQLPPDAEMRLRRLRGLAWLLDRSIGAGEGRRFGLDPLLGLIPGVGDWLGGGLSLYVVYEALRLGLPWPVLGRMLLNIAAESVVGTVPVLGDIFDFVWQANYRNLQLVERHYGPRLKPRPARSIAFAFGAIVVGAVVLMALSLWGAVLLVRWAFSGS